MVAPENLSSHALTCCAVLYRVTASFGDTAILLVIWRNIRNILFTETGSTHPVAEWIGSTSSTCSTLSRLPSPSCLGSAYKGAIFPPIRRGLESRAMGVAAGGVHSDDGI